MKDSKIIWPVSIYRSISEKQAEVTIRSVNCNRDLFGITCNCSKIGSIFIFNPEEESNDIDMWSSEYNIKDYLKTWYIYGEIIIRGSIQAYDEIYLPSDLNSKGNLPL